MRTVKPGGEECNHLKKQSDTLLSVYTRPTAGLAHPYWALTHSTLHKVGTFAAPCMSCRIAAALFLVITSLQLVIILS